MLSSKFRDTHRRAGIRADFQTPVRVRAVSEAFAPSALDGCESNKAPRAALVADSDKRAPFGQALQCSNAPPLAAPFGSGHTPGQIVRLRVPSEVSDRKSVV